MFNSGPLVKATTSTEPIQGMQTSILISVENLKPWQVRLTVRGLFHEEPFWTDLSWNIIHAIGDKLLVYDASDPAIKGVFLLLREEIRIRLQQDITTGTMISEFASSYIGLTRVTNHFVTVTKDQTRFQMQIH